jgi:hypothetical protein
LDRPAIRLDYSTRLSMKAATTQWFDNAGLALYANGVYNGLMLTVIETSIFSRIWSDYWSQAEHDDFITHIAHNPDSGDIIPNSGGCRKVRWARAGVGKSGGVRVIYVVRTAADDLILLTMYAKSAKENIPAHILRKIAEEVRHGSH